MKHYIMLIFLFVIAMTCCACSPNLSIHNDNSMPISNIPSEAHKSDIIERDYNISDPSTDDYKSFKVNETFKDTIAYSKYMNYSSYMPNKKPEIVKLDFLAENNFIWSIHENEIVYFSSSKEISKIASHNFLTNTSNLIWSTPSEIVGAMMGFADEYIVWKESSSELWLDGKLHLLNKLTGKDTVFFTYPLDENGQYYCAFTNPVVLFENQIYYDVIENNINAVNLYKYDIKEKSTTLVDNIAQGPFIYDGSVYWHKLDNINKSIYFSNKDNKLPLQINSNSNITVQTSYNNASYLILYEWLNTQTTDALFDEKASAPYTDKDELTAKSYGVKLFTSKGIRPIMVTQEPIGQCIGNDKNVSWNVFGSPQFYNINSDTLVKFETLPPSQYAVITGENKMYYIDYVSKLLYIVVC